jgi:hypothetical protein
MNEITIIFDYKASGGEIDGLEEFVADLKKDYIVHARPNGGPQAGGLWDVFVEFYANISLGDFILGAIAGGLVWDGVKIGTRKFLFKPIIEAFKKLEEKNEYLDYTPILRMNFDDVQLKFYGVDRNFFVGMSQVFNVLLKHYEKISNLCEHDLYEIHIPALLDKEDKEREVYIVSPYMEQENPDFTKFWGMSYMFDHHRDVLDVKNLILLDKDWQREGSMYKSR